MTTTLSDLDDYFLIEASCQTGDEDVILIYKDLLSRLGGRTKIAVLQDFRELGSALSLEDFDKVMADCKKAGLTDLNVATATKNMGRAYTGVLFQEISEKHNLHLKVHYCTNLESAKKWLEKTSVK